MMGGCGSDVGIRQAATAVIQINEKRKIYYSSIIAKR